MISVSLQFSCCFFLAFIAMLLMPRLCHYEKQESLFFLVLGILTQYFDFYTTPVITFVLPMTYLYLLKKQDEKLSSLKALGANAAAWSAGYGLMWLAKLILTSLLTDANGLGQGIASFRGRIGIEKVSGMESYYNPIAALKSVAISLYSDQEGKLIFFGAAAIFVLLTVYRFFRCRHHLRALLCNWHLLILASLPVIWFMAAAQPTANHHWFQYRGITASFWAFFLYLQLLLSPDSKTS